MMFHTSANPPQGPNKTPVDKVSLVLVALETILVTMALLPAKVWAAIPGTTSSNGPFPAQIAPVIIMLIYLLPALIGFLSRRWQHALLFASLPAWIGLGVFFLLSSVRLGAFYIVAADRISANVSTVELFVALGGAGWLTRILFSKMQ